ncbi:MAG: hypothetical protein ACLSHE_02870 [Roseburia sp.]
MSAYFISTNLIKVKEAAKELSELYGKTADKYIIVEKSILQFLLHIKTVIYCIVLEKIGYL